MLLEAEKFSFCFGPDGNEVQISGVEEHSEDYNEHEHDEHGDHEHEDHEHEDHEHEDHEGEADEDCEKKCHFHAGVEYVPLPASNRVETNISRHCVCVGGENSSSRSETDKAQCARKDRDYNVPLRIGLTFAILATSAIGSFPDFAAASECCELTSQVFSVQYSCTISFLESVMPSLFSSSSLALELLWPPRLFM
jgi:zinc transporter 1/2/3